MVSQLKEKQIGCYPICSPLTGLLEPATAQVPVSHRPVGPEDVDFPSGFHDPNDIPDHRESEPLHRLDHVGLLIIDHECVHD